MQFYNKQKGIKHMGSDRNIFLVPKRQKVQHKIFLTKGKHFEKKTSSIRPAFAHDLRCSQVITIKLSNLFATVLLSKLWRLYVPLETCTKISSMFQQREKHKQWHLFIKTDCIHDNTS